MSVSALPCPALLRWRLRLEFRDDSHRLRELRPHEGAHQFQRHRFLALSPELAKWSAGPWVLHPWRRKFTPDPPACRTSGPELDALRGNAGLADVTAGSGM